MKLGNFKKTPEMLGISGKVLKRSTKRQILPVVLQNYEKSALKDPKGKPMFSNFVDLLNIFLSFSQLRPHGIYVFDTF